jgi:hypothetical protein
MVTLACAAVLSAGLSAPATAAAADEFETPAGTVVTQEMMQDAGLAQAVSNGLAFWHSSKCLDIVGYSGAEGATAGQWDCNGAPNQQWTFEWYTATSFQLRVSHTGKCLDLVGYSSANGAAFGQWTCNGAPNQRFMAYDSGVGGWIFQVQHSGKCIDIIGFATGNGATAGQWDCNWAANQRIVWI